MARLISTKYRPEVCDDLYWAPLPDGRYLSEKLPDAPTEDVKANVARLLTVEYITSFDHDTRLEAIADEQITAMKRARAAEVKLDAGESDREVQRMVEINTRLLTERDAARARIVELEAQVKAGGGGGLKTQPEDESQLAAEFEAFRRDTAAQLKLISDSSKSYRDDAEAQIAALRTERDAALEALKQKADSAEDKKTTKTDGKK